LLAEARPSACFKRAFTFAAHAWAMLLGLKRTGAETDAVLARLGLTLSDVSGAGLKALKQLEAERALLARRLAEAEALADHDSLTGVLNHRAFMRELHRTMSEVERYKSSAAVLYLDLDGFKAINDRYGHAAGDAVLKNLARILSDSVRESDAVGRLGGDEFGIILNRATAEEARAKADALGARIEAATIGHAGVTHRVSASLGVHPIARVETPETAVARADEAMYADKHARRLRASPTP
jgi:diguanylate cyclase (GGDEF)-like protein